MNRKSFLARIAAILMAPFAVKVRRPLHWHRRPLRWHLSQKTPPLDPNRVDYGAPRQVPEVVWPRDVGQEKRFAMPCRSNG